MGRGLRAFSLFLACLAALPACEPRREARPLVKANPAKTVPARLPAGPPKVAVSPDAGVLSELRETVDARSVLPAPKPERPVAAPGGHQVRITTSHGSFTIDLFVEDAPLHAENFMKLAREGSLDGWTFHKVLENHMASAGAPDAGDAAEPGGSGKGVSGQALHSEVRRKHVRGSVGAPRVPRPADPARPSSGSEFYISFLPLPDLDGVNTVFGQVVEGMDVVDRLKRGTGPGGALVPPGSGDKILSAN